MSAKLSYSSTDADSTLDPAFEQALQAARKSAEPVAHYLEGQWVRIGVTVQHLDPCGSGKPVATYHAATDEMVASAIQAAKRASSAWRHTSYRERCETLRKAARGYETRMVELAAIASAETGKIRVESLAEVTEAIDIVNFYADQMIDRAGFAFEIPNRGEEIQQDVLLPYGVFGVIAPFNFPVALAVNMTVAALLTGNTVVAKPSAKAPRSTTQALAVLAEALPPGVLNIVQGDVETGLALVRGPVDGIAFTGSADVGWGIVKELARRPWPRPVLAEMGGQNPAIVTASADLDAAVSGIVRSAFGLSGQKCSACRRVVVERVVADDLIGRLKAAAEKLSVGDPSERSSQLGPVIDGAAAKRIDVALEVASRDGRVVTGGRLAGAQGHYFKPIIVTGLPKGHPLTREELFGPFLSVVVVDSFEDAIAEANDVEYGLSAGLFSRDKTQQRDFLDRIEAGVVYVNRAAGATTGAWPGIQSFCGWKASGSTGKGGLNAWYLPGFMREQSRTTVRGADE